MPLPQPLEAKPAAEYATAVKTAIGTAVDSADLIAQLTTFDADALRLNARLVQGMKNALQTLAFTALEQNLILEAITTLGGEAAGFDLP
ncbi:hypothetical protein [Microbulbifer taiwanensis]|uniref:Uncharacterized protein n=1 Tax=Microbulbifer taiwanensis TaxID=986746 RepID=A0ABW1YPM6_9GAMM|nr:hypothetical protein [Microbulbifer taiwanensis]